MTTEGADSDFYEAHAVLLNLKRKQMDSAGGTLAYAREIERVAWRHRWRTTVFDDVVGHPAP